MRRITDEHLILGGMGDRDGAHGESSGGEDNGKRFIYNCKIRRQC